MRNYYGLVGICLFFTYVNGLAQPKLDTLKLSLKLSERLPCQADVYYGRDDFDFDYYYKNQVLIKKRGNEIYEYKNLSFGKLSRLDLQNPLRLILFFENFNAVIALDNQLNEVQRIHFSDLPEPLVATALGLSAQNKLWIYHQLQQRLVLIDMNRRQLTNIGNPVEDAMLFYHSDFNFFYWINAQRKLKRMDLFGKQVELMSFHEFDKIHMDPRTYAVWIVDKKWHLFDFRKSTIYELSDLPQNIQNFYVRDQKLSIFTEDEILIYQILTN
jgi:hypothetical protein